MLTTACVAGILPPGTDGIAASDADPVITVTVLGSGTPAPSRTQFGASVLVQAGDEYFMFDCGRGCTGRLAQLDPALVPRVSNLFVTHLHSDHLTGIPDLWLNGWTQNRTAPLTVWGPAGTQHLMEGFRTAFSQDIAYRHADGVPAPSAGLDSDFHELLPEGGVVYDRDGIKVTAFLVDHASVAPAYGYKLEYRDRSVVMSGDTTTTQSLYEFGEGADILMLEVMSPALIDYVEQNYSPVQVAAILSLHLTVEQAADIFMKTEPTMGVYYHTRNEPQFAEPLITCTSEVYAGPLVVAHDLLQLRIMDDGSVATTNLNN